MVVGIGTLLCPVRDMDRAVAFYRDCLGLVPGFVSSPWSEFDLGGVRLGLHPPFSGGPSGTGWIVGIQVNDIAECRARLAAAGYPTDAAYHDIPGGVVLDFRDPDGNALQAMQPGITVAQLA
jgi:predicted enzyme related to lactoylglutathione lyase